MPTKTPLCGHHKKPMLARDGFLEQSGQLVLPTTQWVCQEPRCEEVRWDRAAPGTAAVLNPKYA